VHGGYRLQEVLLVHNDFVIIDFEGDRGARSRSVAPSSRPCAMWPACCVRSIWLAEWRCPSAHSDTEIARREPVAQTWGDTVRQTFLQAYGEAAVAAGLYADLDSFSANQPLLELFEIDQALHELHGELVRRPDAVAAPLASLAALASV
jgi:maltose alpha-D-glucosyltransferase/alpha-amylase